jgi:hypothetical protein
MAILGNLRGQRADIRLQENFPKVRFGVDARDMAAPKRRLECADGAEAVNSGADRRGSESAALNVMGQYADLGAMDSEPLWRLGEVLDRLYDRRGRLR